MNGRLLLTLRFISVVIISMLSYFSYSQNPILPPFLETDSLETDSTILASSQVSKDSIITDTTSKSTNFVKKISKNAIEDKVIYDAKDSIIVNVKSRTAYLFGEAVVFYDDLELRADYIEMSFEPWNCTPAEWLTLPEICTVIRFLNKGNPFLKLMR